ncbi:MAG: hypothetical protein Q9190_000991 [Brigantiaea leucoxantha]
MSGAVAPPVAAQGFAVPVSSSSYAGPDESRPTSPSPLSNSRSFPFILKASGSARHTIGIFLLLVTVFLWTASQFLASTIFADDTYSKPFLVTYINSTFFSTLLIFPLFRTVWTNRRSIFRVSQGKHRFPLYAPVARDENEDSIIYESNDRLNTGTQSARDPWQIGLEQDDRSDRAALNLARDEDVLDIAATARLGFEFYLLWFIANYFTAACLEYTTVASSTILTSTSSIWTLIIGATTHVEHFTMRKFAGVIASFAGVSLISSVDLSGSNDKNRGSFPHKSPGQIAVGDAFALFSAVLYGAYTTLIKKRIRNESRVNMALFFGFVGIFSTVTLVPGFPILHYTGIEKFELPPTKRVVGIILINAASSLVSDLCWAYSMLLTSPLVVTVGLSLTIPLSLLGQVILNDQTSSVTYWIGAVVVVLSFLFINHESKEQEVAVSRFDDAD